MMRRARHRLHGAPPMLLVALVTVLLGVVSEVALLLRGDSDWHGVDELALLLTLGALVLLVSQLRDEQQPGEDRRRGDAGTRG